MKTCTKCGHPKPIDGFPQNRSKPDGRAAHCLDCKAGADQIYRDANREKLRTAGRERRRDNPESAREQSRRSREKYPERNRGRSRRWRSEHLEEVREQQRASYAADRAAVLDHYGRTCACCGTADRPTIDHVNGDGREHREEIGRKIYRWLVENDFPSGFQTLCRPCNISKRDGDRCRIDHDGCAVSAIEAA
jgi:hypothetical protein